MRLLVLFAVVCYVAGTSALYSQCKGANFENLEEKISLNTCKKTYCRLKKRTKVQVEMKFTPEKDTKQLTNTVSADIAGIPFPFIGMDGTNACNSIFEADGTTKASCPLKAGTEYVYHNEIDVLDIYPRIKVVVHWALTGPHGDVICFEVPARITN